MCHVIMQKAETFHSYEYLAGQTWTYVAADTINGQGQIAMLSRCGSDSHAQIHLMLSPRRNSMSNLPVQQICMQGREPPGYTWYVTRNKARLRGEEKACAHKLNR